MQVYKAMLKGATEPVALKLISWDGLEMSADVRRRAMRELSHLRDCNHPHIVQCHGACVWDGQIAIVTELLHYGNLHSALANRSLQWSRR